MSEDGIEREGTKRNSKKPVRSPMGSDVEGRFLVSERTKVIEGLDIETESKRDSRSK